MEQGITQLIKNCTVVKNVKTIYWSQKKARLSSIQFTFSQSTILNSS